MNNVYKSLPGWMVTLGLALAAKTLALVVPQIGSILIGLILGIAVASLVRSQPIFAAGIAMASKHCLTIAITLFGANLKISHLQQLNWNAGFFVVLVVLLTLALYKVLAKLLKLDEEASLLVAIGSAICGSAAIAACASLVTKDQYKVGASLTVINLVGLLSIGVYPLFLHNGLLTSVEYSWLVGGTLQSVGHVMALAELGGREVFDISLVIKMARVILLLPLTFYLSFFFTAANGQKARATPLYLWGFLIAFLIGNLQIIPEPWLLTLSLVDKFLLLIAMVAIGLQINLRDGLKLSPKLFLLALLLQGQQIVIFLLCQ